MSRSKTLAVLQKTYDDSYLSCSTAVYHESQGNEIEAMRHWRGALDQIYEHNANKITPTYIPRSDTEKALIEALKQLELQCKERIDLLEALRVSRRDSPTTEPGGSGAKKQTSNNISDHPGKGSIGQGTIPAVTYSELSRPALLSRPSLPNRPSASSRTSLEAAHTTGNGYENEDLAAPSTSTPKSRSPARPAGPHGAGRALSPDKYTMRTTLRTGKPGEKAPRSSRKSPNPAAEGPSKAATLAWSSLSSREKPSRMAKPIFESPSSSQFRSQSSFDQAPNTTQRQWDSHSRRLVTPVNTIDLAADADSSSARRDSDELAQPSHLSVSAASSALTSAQEVPSATSPSPRNNATRIGRSDPIPSRRSHDVSRRNSNGNSSTAPRGSITSPAEDTIKRKVVPRVKPKPRKLSANHPEIGPRARPRVTPTAPAAMATSSSEDDGGRDLSRRNPSKPGPARAAARDETPEDSSADESVTEDFLWKKKKETLLKNLPPGVDEPAAKQILNDIIVQGDEVRWTDVAGLDVAKNALREAVVYPFLRPDLFMGLREPARGMLLFGPPGTGKTMLARAVATESKSTFFSISASSLTSKFLGESEKLVRALFGLAKVLAPSIIFVDEIDSLLSQRSGSGEHEATRRIKTEFLIQWSDLQRAAAGRETTDRDKERGDANRVLVLAATNLPWAIDEAARRRFVRRQYIPLPESTTRETQLKTLLAQQKHGLSEDDIATLVDLTEGFSGSDITALAKDAAMGPLRSLGDALLHMTMDDIRPIALSDFQLSLGSIRPSVSNAGLKEYEDWAKEFGERGG